MLSTGTNRRFISARLSWHRLPRLATLALAFLTAALPLATRTVRAADTQASLALAPHGTPFFFEVIDSHDAKYPGDTPAHRGKDGGLTVRPNVALRDPVYRTVNKATTVIGKVTLVQWDRVSGSLTVEFDPEPLHRIAVGDEVWIDLNPLPSKPSTPVPSAP
jgi:hypothetical protein